MASCRKLVLFSGNSGLVGTSYILLDISTYAVRWCVVYVIPLNVFVFVICRVSHNCGPFVIWEMSLWEIANTASSDEFIYDWP